MERYGAGAAKRAALLELENTCAVYRIGRVYENSAVVRKTSPVHKERVAGAGDLNRPIVGARGQDRASLVQSHSDNAIIRRVQRPADDFWNCNIPATGAAEFYDAAISIGKERAAAGLVDKAGIQTKQAAVGRFDRAVVLVQDAVIVDEIQLHGTARIVAIDRAVINQLAATGENGSIPVQGLACADRDDMAAKIEIRRIVNTPHDLQQNAARAGYRTINVETKPGRGIRANRIHHDRAVVIQSRSAGDRQPAARF